MEKISIVFVLTQLLLMISAKILTHQVVNGDIWMKVNQYMTKEEAEKYCQLKGGRLLSFKESDMKAPLRDYMWDELLDFARKTQRVDNIIESAWLGAEKNPETGSLVWKIGDRMIDMEGIQVNMDLCRETDKCCTVHIVEDFDPWLKALSCDNTMTMEVICQFTPHELALESVNLLSSSLKAETSEREALDKQVNSISNNQVQVKGLGGLYALFSIITIALVALAVVAAVIKRNI